MASAPPWQPERGLSGGSPAHRQGRCVWVLGFRSQERGYTRAWRPGPLNRIWTELPRSCRARGARERPVLGRASCQGARPTVAPRSLLDTVGSEGREAALGSQERHIRSEPGAQGHGGSASQTGHSRVTARPVLLRPAPAWRSRAHPRARRGTAPALRDWLRLCPADQPKGRRAQTPSACPSGKRRVNSRRLEPTLT